MAVDEGVGRTDVPFEKDLSIKQTAFKSEDVSLLRCERVELGWIMIYEDKKIENPEEYLDAITVNESPYFDGFEPRTPSYRLHCIEIKRGDSVLIDYTYDPYK